MERSTGVRTHLTNITSNNRKNELRSKSKTCIDPIQELPCQKINTKEP